MCTDCGCGGTGGTESHIHRVNNPLAPVRPSSAPLAPLHVHHLEKSLLQRNDTQADSNRRWFAQHNILALNLLSSPGAGKTTLLEKTLQALRGDYPLAVIEGDQATARDGERIAATGVKVVQVNTGTGCHLEADMIHRAAHQLEPLNDHLLFIENVGNLVCPALFDLGEFRKVVLLSVTEGDDKPLKYPHMFQAADLVLITKMDLLPHVDFSIDACMNAARQLKPDVPILCLSARTGAGMEAWLQWIGAQRALHDSAAEKP
jgi:hydrogenase nickel incorporation protein HypB